MIALHHNLPLVAWNKQRPLPLSEGWLTESIVESAEMAGVPNWELSVQVAKAILFFIQRDVGKQLLSVEDLRSIIRKSLRGIGYPKVAEQALVVAPRLSIHLPDLARQDPYELLFFSNLQFCIEEARRIVVRGVRLQGLRHAVKIIDGCRHWRPSCDRLSNQIVDFTRQQAAVSQHQPLDLLIC